MAKYIDADALLKAMDERYKAKKGVVPNVLAEGFLQMEKLIKEQPAADVAPIVHGEWIPQDMTYTKFMCNQCNSKNHSGYEKFCPNCGADMRKKVEE